MADQTLTLSATLPDGRVVNFAGTLHTDGSADFTAVHVAAPVAPPPPPPPPVVKPLPITGLKATATSTPSVTISWDAYPAAAQGVTAVVIKRGGLVIQAAYPVAWTAYLDAGTLAASTTYTYEVLAAKADGTRSDPAGVSITTPGTVTPPPPPPPPPAKLPAPSQSVAQLSPGGTMITYSCASVTGAASYRLHDTTDGSNPDTSPTAKHYDSASPVWTIPVVAGAVDVMHRLCAAGVDAAGVVGICAADSMVTVPHQPVTPPPPPPPPVPVPMTMGPVPKSVRVVGSGSGTDALHWGAVKGAVKYNIYQDDKLIGTSATPDFVAPSVFGRFYTITAIDAMGMESMASAPAQANGGTRGGADQAHAVTLSVAPEWNNGAGRLVLSWKCYAYWGNWFNVYRDGQLYADHIPIWQFIDEAVTPGQSHSYQVTAFSAGSEGAKSTPVVGVAPSSGPAGGGTLAIAGTTPNHNSMKVSVKPYPNAVDYRCYVLGHPEKCKYAGIGGTTIEWNGVDPAGAMPVLVVEALDKLGPFMAMDGTSVASDPFVSRATRPMPPGMPSHINGQGDPSNVPNVLASTTVAVTLSPKRLTGAQAFLDTFDSNQPFVQAASVDPEIFSHDPFVTGSKPNNASNPYIKRFTNDKWRADMWIADAQATKIFFMSRHLMDTLYDGGTPGGGGGDSTPPHNNNSSITFTPIGAGGAPLAFDFSGGRVLHVTMEVDSHFTPRRWCDMGIYPAGDVLVDPAIRKLNFAALEAPTQSGNILTWEIQAGLPNLTQTIGAGGGKVVSGGYHDAINQGYPGDHGTAAARDQGNPSANGTQAQLDLRRTFDLYTDGHRVVIMEGGKVSKDTSLPVALPFSKAHVYYAHHVYHTINEISEAAMRGNEPMYTNYRQGCDERHWAAMGAEVLASWPF